MTHVSRSLSFRQCCVHIYPTPEVPTQSKTPSLQPAHTCDQCLLLTLVSSVRNQSRPVVSVYYWPWCLSGGSKSLGPNTAWMQPRWTRKMFVHSHENPITPHPIVRNWPLINDMTHPAPCFVHQTMFCTCIPYLKFPLRARHRTLKMVLDQTQPKQQFYCICTRLLIRDFLLFSISH